MANASQISHQNERGLMAEFRQEKNSDIHPQILWHKFVSRNFLKWEINAASSSEVNGTYMKLKIKYV